MQALNFRSVNRYISSNCSIISPRICSSSDQLANICALRVRHEPNLKPAHNAHVSSSLSVIQLLLEADLTPLACAQTLVVALVGPKTK